MESDAVPGQLNLLGEFQMEEPEPLPIQQRERLDESTAQTLLIIDTETSGLDPDAHHCLSTSEYECQNGETRI